MSLAHCAIGKRLVFCHWDDVEDRLGRFVRLDRHGRVVYAPGNRKCVLSEPEYVTILQHCGRHVQMVRVKGVLRTDMPKEVRGLKALHERLNQASLGDDGDQLAACLVCGVGELQHCPLCDLAVHNSCMGDAPASLLGEFQNASLALRRYQPIVQKAAWLCPWCLALVLPP